MQRTYKEPKKYVVGTDITTERYQELLIKIADWLSESRATKEPALLAQQLFQDCLDGVKRDGSKWFGAATSTLAQRIRIKCAYDIEKMEPLREAGAQQRAKKSRETRKARQKLEQKREEALLPIEVRQEQQKLAKFGDDPGIFFTQEEQRKWNELHDSYVGQFPELSTVNATAELSMLCDLHIQWDRIRMRANKGLKIPPEELQGITKQMSDLKKMLGIHPDQFKNKMKKTDEYSVGAAVARLDELGWKELRERFWVEELIQLWMMYHTPKADGNGYQLDEIGLFGLTKSKVVNCPSCGTVHFAGLNIKEIQDYLVTKGYIVPLTDNEKSYIDTLNGQAKQESV